MNILLTWSPTIISFAFLVALFVGRHWLEARIKGNVKHEFDKELAAVTTEIRKSEELFKGAIRAKEEELVALRDRVLGGQANRQSLLDKRRFEAVEKVWTAVNDLASLKPLSTSMAILNFKAVAKDADDPRVQQFLSVIGAAAPNIESLKNVARDERPFLPEIAWAYFAAYTTILYGALARFSALKSRVKEVDKYLSADKARKVLKAALPHQQKFIDDQEPEAYHYLLEEIEDHLLAVLRHILEGKEADKDDAARAKAIMAAVKDADEQKAQEHIPEEYKRSPIDG